MAGRGYRRPYTRAEEEYYYQHKARKTLEFFQRVVLIAFIFSTVIVVLTITANFMLLWTNRMPMTQETVTAITVYGGITSGITAVAYAALQGVRTWSLNKHCGGHIPENDAEGGEEDDETRYP